MKFDNVKESRNERVYVLTSYKLLKNEIEEMLENYFTVMYAAGG